MVLTGQATDTDWPGHAGLGHEDEVHVAGDDGDLWHAVHVRGRLRWLALRQQQVQQQLQVRFPVGGLADQQHHLHAREPGVLLVLATRLQNRSGEVVLCVLHFLFVCNLGPVSILLFLLIMHVICCCHCENWKPNFCHCVKYFLKLLWKCPIRHIGKNSLHLKCVILKTFLSLWKSES